MLDGKPKNNSCSGFGLRGYQNSSELCRRRWQPCCLMRNYSNSLPSDCADFCCCLNVLFLFFAYRQKKITFPLSFNVFQVFTDTFHYIYQAFFAFLHCHLYNEGIETSSRLSTMFLKFSLFSDGADTFVFV